jgi:hypothetical protein
MPKLEIAKVENLPSGNIAIGLLWAALTVAGNDYCFIYIQKGTSGLEEPYFSVNKPDSFVLSYVLNSYVATAGSHYGMSLYTGQSINVIVSDV